MLKIIRTVPMLLFFLLSDAFCGVVINEFVNDPLSTDTGKEWIELYNNSSLTENISGWKIEKDNNLPFPGTVIVTIPNGVILSSSSFYLIIESSTAVSGGVIDYNLNATLGLGNASSQCDGIRLTDGSGVEMDKVVYGGQNKDTHNIGAEGGAGNEAPKVKEGSSVARKYDGIDTDSNSFDFIELTVPTPRNPNSTGGASTGTAGGLAVRISEVAPGISGGDFVEFYVKEECNLAGAKVYEGTTLIKTFQNLGAKKAEYIILHASKKGTDDTGDSLPAGEKYWEVYSDESSPGLTGTDNNITLKDSAGNIIDFMSFANNSGSYTGSTSAYDAAVSNNQWLPAALNGTEYEQYSVAWSGSTKGSMARRLGTSGTEIGLPVDTNTNSDWVEQSVPNIGRGYGSVFQTTAKLEVNQSPFSPYGDGAYTEAQLAYKVDSGYQVTIRIFDLTGRLVKTIVDKADSSATGASQATSWNGLDDSGNIAPVGIYIVNINALYKATGKSISESKTVVLGKKLK